MSRYTRTLGALVMASLVSAGCGGGGENTAHVTGTVTYLQRMALPPDAQVRVVLEDISRQDAPARFIAADTIAAEGLQVPVSFSIPYDPSKIDESRTYSLRAEITVDGERRFISTQDHLVLTRGAGTDAEIVVMALKTEQPDDSPLVGTYWKLIELGGNAVLERGTRREARITFLTENQRVTASGGCNQLVGGYVTDGDGLTFTPLASTKMRCPDVMEQEAELVAAMAATRSYRIEGPTLELLDGSGEPLARFLAAAIEE